MSESLTFTGCLVSGSKTLTAATGSFPCLETTAGTTGAFPRVETDSMLELPCESDSRNLPISSSIVDTDSDYIAGFCHFINSS